jgi:hypothetical protein
MTEDVTAFLDRCDDVLTDWHGSADAAHYARGVPVDPPGTTFRFGRVRVPVRAEIEWDAEPSPSTPTRPVPVVPDVEFDREAFVEAMRVTFREITEALRPFVHACQDTCRSVGMALHQCSEAAELTGTIHHTLPTDPRERALYLRQHRNTGPQLHRLDGRRRC